MLLLVILVGRLGIELVWTIVIVKTGIMMMILSV